MYPYHVKPSFEGDKNTKNKLYASNIFAMPRSQMAAKTSVDLNAELWTSIAFVFESSENQFK